MSKLIFSTLSTVLLLLLVSCGGDTQPLPTQRTVSHLHAAAARIDADDARYEDLVQRLYLGYFGRPADPAGLTFYTHAYHRANAPETVSGLYSSYANDPAVRELLDSFANSVESNELYYKGSALSFGFIAAFYENLFSRQPDRAGLDFWNRALDKGLITPQHALLSIMAGAVGSDAELLNRKISLAKLFTSTLESSADPAIYAGQLPALMLRALLRSVPAMADQPTASKAAISDIVQRLTDLARGSYQEVATEDHRILLLASAAQQNYNGERLQQLAAALITDLNSIHPGGRKWSVTIATAENTVPRIRDQLRGYHSAMLIGMVPVPTYDGKPAIDPYRLLDCPELAVDEAGVLTSYSFAVADLKCKNGLVISILRGGTYETEIDEVARKLDQMTAYHRNSSKANTGWNRRVAFVDALWGGSQMATQQGLDAAVAAQNMYSPGSFSYVNSGNSAQLLSKFVDCISNNYEVCGVNLSGQAERITFEGPGKLINMNTSDITSWRPADLGTSLIKAKYIPVISAGTQDFLTENSIGNRLLMQGNALLTRGSTVEGGLSSDYMDNRIRSEFPLLRQGATFAEALYGLMEGTYDSIQGDPYITMRSALVGKQPKLVIDGLHYNSGTVALNLTLPDSVNGTIIRKVITYSNRGDADLHLRLAIMPRHIGYKAENSSARYKAGPSEDFTIFTEWLQVFSDGRILQWPEFEVESSDGAMHATLQPGQSMAVQYEFRIALDTQGAPRQKGQYSWDMFNTSDDPDNMRTIITMQVTSR